MAKGFHLGLDAEPGTFAVKLPIIVQYRNVDCDGGMSGRRTKEAMAQKGNIGVIRWVMYERDRFPAYNPTVNAMIPQEEEKNHRGMKW